MEARLPKQAAEGKVHDAIARSLRGVFDELLTETDLRGRRVLHAGRGYGAFSRWAAVRGANIDGDSGADVRAAPGRYSRDHDAQPGRSGQGVVRLASYLHLRPFQGLENFVRRSDLRATCTAPDLDVLEDIGCHAWLFQVGFSGLSRLARKAGRNQALTTDPRASRVC